MNWQTHLRHVNNSPGPDAPIDVPRTQPAENQICRSDRRWPANNNMPNRTTSAKDPKIIRATSHMCGSCLITLSSPGVCSIQDCFVNFFGRVSSLRCRRHAISSTRVNWQKQPTEAVPLIHEPAEHCIQPKYIYGHKWTLGNVVIWDHAPPSSGQSATTGCLSVACCTELPWNRGMMYRGKAQLIGSLRTFGDPVLAPICSSQVFVVLVPFSASICRHPDPESPSASQDSPGPPIDEGAKVHFPHRTIAAPSWRSLETLHPTRPR